MIRHIVKSALASAVAAAAACLLVLGAAQAQSKSDAEASGKAEYDRYCAGCHGYDGKGEGPLANMIPQPPADLTLLSTHFLGAFPMDRVIQIIEEGGDGLAHQRTAMPAWKEAFKNYASPEQARDITRAIAEYIASLQKEE